MTPSHGKRASVTARIESGFGAAKISPAIAPSAIPGPTAPKNSGSCPLPPPVSTFAFRAELPRQITPKVDPTGSIGKGLVACRPWITASTALVVLTKYCLIFSASEGLDGRFYRRLLAPRVAGRHSLFYQIPG